MKITHSDLSNLAVLLGYPKLEKGLCAGFSGMWSNSVLANDEASFYKRLDFIATYKDDFSRLVVDIENVKKKKGTLLEENDIQLLEILSFFDGMELYLNSSYYPDYFPNGKLTSQSDVNDIYYLTRPSLLEKNELQVLLNKDYGFSKKKLERYFDDLALQLSKYPALSFPINLNCHSHSIALSYNETKSCWNYVDTNDFENYPQEIKYVRELDTPALVESIFTSFFTDDNAVFNTRIFGIEGVISNQLHRELQQINLKYPITAEHVIQCDADYVTVLYVACQNGNLNTVREILKFEHSSTNITVRHGLTPLYIACQNGHLEVVKELLKPGYKTNINEQLHNGCTALYAACHSGHLDVIKTLLDSMYKININLGKDGDTPFYIACQSGHLDVVKKLLEPMYNANINLGKDGITPLYIACQNGHLEVVRELLKPMYQIDINRGENGDTPLYIACHNGHLDVVRELLKSNYQVNINVADIDGATPFFIACQNGHLHVVKELLKEEHKTNIKKAMNEGATPFFTACQYGHLELVEELLNSKYELDINQAMDNGLTPFFMACENSHVGIVTLLLASPRFNKNLLEAVDVSGNTPLLNACLSPPSPKNLELIEVLLKHNANISHKNNAQQTAGDIAAAQGNNSAMSALKRYET